MRPMRMEIPAPHEGVPGRIIECPCVISTAKITVFTRDYNTSPISAYELFRAHEGNRLAREEIQKGNSAYDPNSDATFEPRLRSLYRDLTDEVRIEYSKKCVDLNFVICKKSDTLPKQVYARELYETAKEEESMNPYTDWDDLPDDKRKHYVQQEDTENEAASSMYVEFSSWVKNLCAVPLRSDYKSIVEQCVDGGEVQTKH